MDVYYHKRVWQFTYVFTRTENLPRFSCRRWLDDDLTTSHMRRKLVRENFTSARRRGPISLSMLKGPI